MCVGVCVCVFLEVGREVGSEYSSFNFSLHKMQNGVFPLVLMQSVNREEVRSCGPVAPGVLSRSPPEQARASHLPSSFSASVTLETSS